MKCPRNKSLILSLIIAVIIISCDNKKAGVKVVFPDVSEPVQITKSDKEHLFASYYGINSWSRDQRFVTVSGD